MDFAINLTLLVQAINFIIALFILIKFFFNPVIADISGEEGHIKQIQKSIATLKNILKQKKEAAVAQGQEWQKQLYAEQPSVEEYKQFKIITFTQIKEQKVNLEEAVFALSQSIARKVKSL